MPPFVFLLYGECGRCADHRRSLTMCEATLDPCRSEQSVNALASTDMTFDISSSLIDRE